MDILRIKKLCTLKENIIFLLIKTIISGTLNSYILYLVRVPHSKVGVIL